MPKSNRNFRELVGFKVMTGVVVRNSVFGDITRYSPLEVNGHFRGMYRLHLRGWRVSQVRNQHEAGSKLISCDFQRTNNVISQKTDLFMAPSLMFFSVNWQMTNLKGNHYFLDLNKHLMISENEPFNSRSACLLETYQLCRWKAMASRTFVTIYHCTNSFCFAERH
jgi:hypothetical protein